MNQPVQGRWWPAAPTGSAAVALVLILLGTSPPAGAVAGGWAGKSSARRAGTSSLTAARLAAVGERLRAFAAAAPEGLAVRGGVASWSSSRGVVPSPPGLARRRAARQTRPDWRVEWRPETGTPAFIRNLAPSARRKGAATAGRAPAALALDILEANPLVFGLQRPRDEVRHLDTVRDPDGGLHVRFARQVRGVPVWGDDLVLHLDAAGNFRAFNGNYVPSTTVDVTRAIDADAAVAAALTHLLARQSVRQLPDTVAAWLGYDGPRADLVLRTDHEGVLRLVWRVEVRPNLRDRWLYVVDAGSGTVLERWNATPWDGPLTATAVDLAGVTRELDVYQVGDGFLMIDASRPSFAARQPDVVNDPLGALVTLTAANHDLTRFTPIANVTSRDNTWGDPVAVSAHDNMGIVFDYYLTTHGRMSIDGVGGTLRSIIHVTEDGESMDNAFWSGAFMAYGDGGATFVRPLAAALDVAAHEMTHGVIQHTVNLEYRNQSGALNESLADVFAVMVDRDDWQLGEDVVQKSSTFPQGTLRDMADPHNGAGHGDRAWQPAGMDEFVRLPLDRDNGGVHVNSGIPNHACFLMAAAVGREATERIYYRVLRNHLISPRGNFVDMRRAAVQAATELFGDNSPEAQAAMAAFTQVGVVGEGGYQPPAPQTPMAGQEWLLVSGADNNDRGLYLARPVLDSAQDLILLTSTPVYDRTGNAVSVAADGSFVLFVDAANNLRAIDIDGTDETVLSDSRDWASISLSPDGTHLAATTVFRDGTIQLIDFVHPDQSRSIPLRRPTTQEGVTTSVVLYADAMDWDPDGEMLIYDAFNALPTTTGDSLTFWDVSLLDPSADFVVSLFPPQSDGVQLGNPSFGRASGRFVVFDRFDSQARSNQVWVFDLASGKSGFIVDTGNKISYPTFAVDEGELVFERRDTFRRTVVARIRLTPDRLAAAGEAQDFLVNARAANWLVLAEEAGPTTAVGEAQTGPATPLAAALLGNVPNPFNPATSIRFRLPESARARLTIYDVRGARVVDLLDGALPAGVHAVPWDGRDARGLAVASGIYLARLTIDDGGVPQRFTQRMALVR